jgi:uncharacterized protein YcgI (DUF1989 family)
VEFRAEMDCIVGLSNCPLDVLVPCNAYHCTPVKVEVYDSISEGTRDSVGDEPT